MDSATNNPFVTESRSSKITPLHLEEAARLKALWEAKEDKPTQATFGEKFDLGNQSNVGHYLNGRSPLNLKAALAFSKVLECPISAFSPRLGEKMQGYDTETFRLNQVKHRGGLVIDQSASEEPATGFLPGFESLSIPLLANSGSMGPGSDQLHDEVVVGRITVSPDWARRIVKPTSLENLRFIHGYGDSMEPTFHDGDVLLVDLGMRDLKIDGVYVLEANDRVYIKRVRQRFDGQYEISSDNPTVKTVDVLDGRQELPVLGRVVWAWNGRKM